MPAARRVHYYRSTLARKDTMPLEIGKKAPDFALPDERGELVKLSGFKGRRVVVFFYPKASTPG
ncbi:hypothetical protein AMYX_42640 [Anaeromyxobacter diazotrophicus]|uniref:Alkyl hydroperoxide reductase subunit C/ Thiol specific antioxidant domain-containing protein n=1 Tax=Anaeromyxobacter diazotrophicus TaxID=2590199 RepID=A0A7I9VSU5_9BACT|nr:hypothetical protein AMYX_42640 [Anaeromyxobacter diazotrophicus]